MVGGTGFYLRWYVHGKPNTPRSTHESATLTEQTLERVRPLPACGLHCQAAVLLSMFTLSGSCLSS